MMIFAVFIGGGLGAVLRYLISLAFARFELFLPYQTLLANFIGCLIAGIILTYLTMKNGINPLYKPLLIAGFCGGLTTFSTFSVETVGLMQSGEVIKAFLYIFLSLIICFMATFLGIMLVKLSVFSK